MIFISGGVRSGKSTFAESIAVQYSNERLVYLATAINDGKEMNERIKKHQIDRQDKNFITIEHNYELKNIMSEFQKSDTVLLECLTTLVANEMFINNLSKEECVKNIVCDLCELNKNVNKLIIVSNDLYGELYTYTKQVEDYYNALCEISIKLVDISSSAYEMSYSIPVRRK